MRASLPHAASRGPHRTGATVHDRSPRRSGRARLITALAVAALGATLGRPAGAQPASARTPPRPIERGAVATASRAWEAVEGARAAWVAGRETEHADSLRRALDADGTDDAAWLALARLAAEGFAWDSAQRLRERARPSAVATLERGRDLHRQRRFREADGWHARAIDAARASADTLVLADALAHALTTRGLLSGATAYRATWDTLRTVVAAAAPSTHRFVTCYAEAVEATDATTASVARLDVHADAFLAAGDPFAAARCDEIAAALRSRYASFLELDSLYFRAAERYVAARDEIEAAQMRNQRGWIRVRAGYTTTARRELRKALAVAQAAAIAGLEAAVHVNLAFAARSDGDLDAAARSLAIARSLAADGGDRRTLEDITTGERLLALAGGRHDEVYEAARAAWDSLHALADRPETTRFAVVASHALDAAVRAGDAARVRRWLPRHDSLAAARGAQWRPVADLEIGTAWLRLGNTDSAIARLERAATEYSQSPSVLARIATQLAEAHARTGDLARARVLLDSALVLDATWRRGLETARLRALSRAGIQEFGGRRSNAGAEAVVAALAAKGDAAAAWRYAEWLHHRAVRDAFRDTSETRDAARQDALRRLRAPLPRPARDEAWLTWLVGTDEIPTTAILVTHDTIVAALRPVADSLQSLTARFVAAAESGDPALAPMRRALARATGEALVGTLLAQLPRAVRHLIVIPDEFLHRVPFAMLEADGTSLGARVAVSMLPSIGMRETLRADADAVGRDVIVLADPAAPAADDAPIDAPSWRTALGGARREASFLRQRFPAAEIRRGADASEAALRNAWLRRPAVVHIAAHAIADDRTADGNLLVLAPADGADGFVTAGELSALRLRGALVVLSACRTTSAPVTGADLTASIATALLLGGARAVLATQWEVRDDLMPEFVAWYYDALRRGQDAATALASAQRSAAAAGWAPRDWAGVHLLGDGTWRLPPDVATADALP